MEPPASMIPNHGQQARTLTREQRLYNVVEQIPDSDPTGLLDDIAPEAIDYALHRVRQFRRLLLAARRQDHVTPCAVCGEMFTPARSTGVYCSAACRQRAYRQRST